MLKKLIPIATITYSLALIIASLIRLDNVPKLGISFEDKIFHLFAYFILTVLWFYTFLYSFKIRKKKAIFLAVILSVFFGIIIEVLQGSITASRALDAYDAVANTIGALLAAIVLWFKKSLHVKNL
ncbi:VanZ family protein [Flavivirga eckloniae]|uniref:Teicoplanin resistance protein VanZ n=1 Tax=Flavivirga eckloniae TaxID=1803846 RepID=A0A2K9PPB3_9FLAO|nr:VanZ family protein [Flavivirga eckloniae]AUP78892.1 teicoplanin resistance protein VanZ [Flavivirga eckloniae]